MDKNYWKKYYNSQIAPEQPSFFSKFVLDNYIDEGSSLIELGCGNGRDSLFFARHNIKVTAIDQCDNEILTLNKENTLPNLNFITGDFTELTINTSFDNIYSRFTLHSISDSDENKTLKWAYSHLNNGGKLLIEVRGKKNELYKLGEPVPGEKDSYIYENHYRRFTDLENLSKKLIELGFKIVFSKEDSGFAPFNGTDYTFIRIIAIKNKY